MTPRVHNRSGSGTAPALRGGASAFTLIEVMVAVAILALSLTAIFSSEAGAIKMAARARKMGSATLLVRCKMGEIEEKIANQGLPAVYDSGSDTCCEEAPIDGYKCDWEVDPIILPDNMFATKDPLDPSKSGTTTPGSTTPGSTTPGSTTPGATPGSTSPGMSSSPLGNTPGMQPGAIDPNAMPGAPGALGALGALGATGALGGATGGSDPLAGYRNMDPSALLSGGGLGGLASIAMSFVYPILKPAFESQIRRATVTVHWKEGSTDHTFDVTQYIVADQPAQLSPEQLQQMQQSATPGGTQPGAPGGLGVGQTPGLGVGQTSGFGLPGQARP